MEPGKDPRPDQHPNDGTPGKYPGPPPNSNPKPAPGGVGTDTPEDPSRSAPPKSK